MYALGIPQEYCYGSIQFSENYINGDFQTIKYKQVNFCESVPNTNFPYLIPSFPELLQSNEVDLQNKINSLLKKNISMNQDYLSLNQEYNALKANYFLLLQKYKEINERLSLLDCLVSKNAQENIEKIDNLTKEIKGEKISLRKQSEKSQPQEIPKKELHLSLKRLRGSEENTHLPLKRVKIYQQEDPLSQEISAIERFFDGKEVSSDLDD